MAVDREGFTSGMHPPRPQSRTDEEQARYRRLGNIIGHTGAVGVVGGFISMAYESVEKLTAVEWASGTAAVGVGMTLAHLGGAFNDAARFREGADASVMGNFKNSIMSRKLSWALVAMASAIPAGVGYVAEKERRTEQALWEGLPKMDPNMVVRQVTAAAEYCKGERSGKPMTHDINGKPHAFLCP